MKMTQDEKYMKAAIREAKKAYALDEVPIGCVIVQDGYAREALSMALSVGFYGLGLHKIFARCMPENTPSRNLLHATGFFEEGIERDSILIQGKWENHIRYAILNPDEIHS
jgi:RimJ/RimL family protein N-acetyltransferase